MTSRSVCGAGITVPEKRAVRSCATPVVRSAKMDEEYDCEVDGHDWDIDWNGKYCIECGEDFDE